MIVIRKLLIAGLCFSMLIGCMGCNSSQTSSDTDTVHEKRPAIKKEEVFTDTFAEFLDNPMEWQGPDGYDIVYPAENSENLKTANMLLDFYKSKGYELMLKSDSSPATEKEIIIGETNRPESYKDLDEKIYALTVKNNKLVFGGGHYITLNKAVYQYINQKQPKNGVYAFKADSDLELRRLEKYEYVWGDEFETASLDMSKWMFGNDIARRNEVALVKDDKDVVNVSDGKLKMCAIRYFDTIDSNVQYAIPPAISTKDTMNYLYGYVEMRARVPFGRGAWPALWNKSNGAWSNPELYDYWVEVDIFENFATTDTIQPNLHKWYHNGEHSQNNGGGKSKYKFVSLTNPSYEYHIYGFEWTPNEMNFYIDGQKYTTFDLGLNFDNKSNMDVFKSMPLYLIFDNHLFVTSSSWKPYSDCEIRPEDAPYEFFVDWIRLYQADNTGKLYTKK